MTVLFNLCFVFGISAEELLRNDMRPKSQRLNTSLTKALMRRKAALTTEL